MDGLRKWLTFSKGERVAIISILAAIIVLVLVNLLRPTRVSLDETSLHNLDSLLALRQAAVEEMEQQKTRRVEPAQQE